MGQDYYLLLNLSRNATDADIKKAYRKLSLLYHPDKNVTLSEQAAAEKFVSVSEAYDVLSDPRKKAVYDQFGEEGLKSGVPAGSSEQSSAWTDGYTFHGNAEKVFRDFFGGENPFQEFYDRIDGDMHMSFGGLNGRSAKTQDPPIKRELVLSLDETFHGCTKKMKISRRVMNPDGHTSSIRDKILTINVKKGWKEGTAITFRNEGDQGPNNIPADIVFVLRDKKHQIFRRQGENLHHVTKVLLGKALTGFTVIIQTLDDRLLHIPITDIVKPGYKKVVPGEGMPRSTKPEERGDMIIEFELDFPRTLSSDRKEMLKVALL